MRSLRAARDRPWAAKIFALGIPQVGITTATTLAREYPDLARFASAGVDDLASLPDIGPVVAEAIVAWFADPATAALLDDLRAVGFFKEQEEQPPPLPAAGTKADPFAGRTFVLTGTLEQLTRDQARRHITRLGGKVAGNVSKRTDAVVAGARSGAKLGRARELGVPVWDEGRLRRELMNAGAALDD